MDTKPLLVGDILLAKFRDFNGQFIREVLDPDGVDRLNMVCGKMKIYTNSKMLIQLKQKVI